MDDFDHEAFRRLVESWEIPYFQPHELLVLGGSHHSPGHRAHGLNTHPPRELWPNIRETLEVASLARAEVGPLVVTSAYRSPKYNRAVGGVLHSQHVQFRALDLVPLECSARQLHRALHELRDQGSFSGGLGLYSSQGFVHVDTRGRNASWGE